MIKKLQVDRLLIQNKQKRNIERGMSKVQEGQTILIFFLIRSEFTPVSRIMSCHLPPLKVILQICCQETVSST